MCKAKDAICLLEQSNMDVTFNVRILCHVKLDTLKLLFTMMAQADAQVHLQKRRTRLHLDHLRLVNEVLAKLELRGLVFGPFTSVFRLSLNRDKG